MWNNIRERIARAVGGTIYSLYGGVGYNLSYENNVVTFTVYDKSFKCTDKTEIIKYEFQYDIVESGELKSICDIVEEIEKELYK